MMGAAKKQRKHACCCEVDDLSCLGMLQKCRRLYKVVDILHHVFYRV